MAQYYDLVAGLPVLALEGGKAPDYASTLDALADAMTPEDARGLWRLRLVHDSSNLANAVLGLPLPFDPRGNWSPDDLKREMETPDEMPDFMTEFVRSNGAGGVAALDKAFYFWAAEKTSGWVRSWFLFELHLRAASTALMNRRYPRSAAAVDLPEVDEIVSAVKRGSGADFGVAMPCPWISDLVRAVEAGPMEAELAADRIRWETAGELVGNDSFSECAIYAFAVRLGLASRWSALNSETGRRRLERLVDTLKVSAP